MLVTRNKLIIGIILLFSLFGCSDAGNSSETDSITEANVEVEETKEDNESPNKVEESLSLPEGFPADFPLPDNIIITEIDDESDEEKYSFTITFNFDPKIDMDRIFNLYDEYANGLEYNVIIGGEEYFAEGIFQYGATSKFSASDMFIVTLQPEGDTYGSIQVKESK